MKGRTSIMALSAAFLAISQCWAESGDTLYVQKSEAAVHTGPGINHSILLKIGKGHELIELSRQGEWINVGIARTGGKDGWIHSSLVGSVSSGGATVAPADPKFDAFVRDVEKLNDKAESIAGFPFFTKIENLGDGIVQLTAHDGWLSAPRSNREDNLETLFYLWSQHEGSGLPVAVYITNRMGEVVMRR